MKTGEFSIKSNISIDTIRYYEKLGLLHPNKLANNRKDYTEDNLKQLQLITMLKKLNLTLNDIGVLFNLDAVYDAIEDNLDAKIDIIKESESILKKAYSNLLETENQIRISKQLLEKSINKIDKVLENVGDLP